MYTYTLTQTHTHTHIPFYIHTHKIIKKFCKTIFIKNKALITKWVKGARQAGKDKNKYKTAKKIQ